MSAFKSMIKQEREQRNLNMNEMANLLDVKADTYRKYERGDREPSLDKLISIAKKLQVTADYLLNDKKD